MYSDVKTSPLERVPCRPAAPGRPIEMPITESVCRLLDGEIDARAAAEALLRRDPKAESGAV